jgi:2-dehydro-3-deoxyphosphooctonate aldolase (KDO 8-P synthase)
VAAGVDGVFLEVHDDPKVAKSDGANALESTKLREVLKELLAVRQALDIAHATP